MVTLADHAQAGAGIEGAPDATPDAPPGRDAAARGVAGEAAAARDRHRQAGVRALQPLPRRRRVPVRCVCRGGCSACVRDTDMRRGSAGTSSCAGRLAQTQRQALVRCGLPNRMILHVLARVADVEPVRQSGSNVALRHSRTDTRVRFPLAAINYVWGPPNEVCPAYGNTCPCYPNQCGGPCATKPPSLGACALSENVTFQSINLCANGSITFTVRRGAYTVAILLPMNCLVELCLKACWLQLILPRHRQQGLSLFAHSSNARQ